jgi:uncharacterized protein YuzE
MSKPSYHVSLSIEERTGRMLAANFRVRKGKATDTEEVVEGRVFADYDADGSLLGVEFLAPCSATVLDSIALAEDDKRFIQRTAPRELLAV